MLMDYEHSHPLYLSILPLCYVLQHLLLEIQLKHKLDLLSTYSVS